MEKYNNNSKATNPVSKESGETVPSKISNNLSVPLEIDSGSALEDSSDSYSSVTSSKWTWSWPPVFVGINNNSNDNMWNKLHFTLGIIAFVVGTALTIALPLVLKDDDRSNTPSPPQIPPKETVNPTTGSPISTSKPSEPPINQNLTFSPVISRSKSPSATPTKFPTFQPSQLSMPFSPAPTGSSRVSLVKQVLISKNISNPVHLNTHGSPEKIAMEWIANEDRQRVPINDKSFVQRYVLSLLYFTNGGDTWANSTGWLDETAECDWFGINDDPGRLSETGCGAGETVRSIALDSNDMKGSIPSELFLLTDLVLLNLDSNCLKGSISPRIGDLTSLEYLSLDRNDFEGTIPSELWEMSTMSFLSLYYNDLGGKITLDSALCMKQPSDVFITMDCAQCPDWNHILDGGPCCDNCWINTFDPPDC